jgi:hypothetical protein
MKQRKLLQVESRRIQKEKEIDTRPSEQIKLLVLPPKVWSREHEKPGYVHPICVAMKKRRKSLPKGHNSAHELDHCCGKRSLLIVVASSDVKANRGTTTSQKVAPFNILDSETRRSNVSLHVPPANPNVDEEFTASP